MTLTFPSFAKINWTLEILGKRADGYHELRTLLQTISLADELGFTPREQGIEIICDQSDVPCDETNLVHRAARLLVDLSGTEKGVSVTINKRIPRAAGLGGGSSNAAITLLALQKLWHVDLSRRDLFALGSRLGADVPFFLMGGTCLGIGRGDEVYPLEEIEVKYLLLVNPGIHAPTREVYGGLPPELTNDRSLGKMPLSLEAAFASMVEKSDLPLLHNDLEGSVFTRYPVLSEIKERLMRSGARGVLMSGSGSTVFAIFDSEMARSGALKDLSATGWWCAPARTLSRLECQQAYRQATSAGNA
jgi:4-diphosphocytidyl-2-C-methyl-D-erythritol kinase